MANNTTATPARRITFMDLDPKVRNRIYDLAIHDEYRDLFWPEEMREAKSTGIMIHWGRKAATPQPRLSKVSSAMRKEVLDIFWQIPRVLRPYINQLSLPEIDDLKNKPTSRLAPRGIPHLKQFNVHWDFRRLYPIDPRDPGRYFHVQEVYAKAYIHNYPAGHIALLTKPRPRRHLPDIGYEDFMQALLKDLHVNTRMSSRTRHGYEWTVAKFRINDVVKMIQRIHFVLWRHDEGNRDTKSYEEFYRDRVKDDKKRRAVGSA